MLFLNGVAGISAYLNLRHRFGPSIQCQAKSTCPTWTRPMSTGSVTQGSLANAFIREDVICGSREFPCKTQIYSRYSPGIQQAGVSIKENKIGIKILLSYYGSLLNSVVQNMKACMRYCYFVTCVHMKHIKYLINYQLH